MTEKTPNLTSAQIAILSDLVAGSTPKEIAYRRAICLKTIWKHMADARGRLGANTRDQAIAMFVTQYGMTKNKKVVA